MTIKARPSSSFSALSADVCVIGSGAGGAIIAKELAESGRHVVILEKGCRFSRTDFVQQEERMFPQLFEEAGMRATRDQAVIILHGKAVGGTTVVNHNICFRAPAFVLDEWSRLGLPDMAPRQMSRYYDRVEKELGVVRIREDEVSRNGQIFQRGAERLGVKPQRFFHNRKHCIGCGFCYCSCAYERKMDMTRTYLPKAEAAGATLLANTEAQQLEWSRHRVTAVMASQRDPADPSGERRLRVEASLVVVAGGSISTPALLLRSGLGRLNGNIGRHLTLHPLLPSLGLMEEPVYFYEGIPQCAYVDGLASSDGGGYLLEDIGAHPFLTSLVIPSFGAHHRSIMSQYNHLNAHYVMVKDRPQGRVRVRADGSPVIDYTLHEQDRQSLRAGIKLSLQVFFAAGAKQVSLNHADLPIVRGEEDVRLVDRLALEPNRMTLFSPHQMSSCRMGANPKTSVTDAYGKVHGMDNLYLSDASLFPTSLGYNPQLTVMALAARNVEFLLNQQCRSSTTVGLN